MSLVPSLTISRKKRDKLNGLRNTFTYFANLTVLLLALLFFSIIEFFLFWKKKNFAKRINIINNFIVSNTFIQ